MSRVSDLTCNETMSSVEEAERKDTRRFFQQPVGLPIARIAPVMPSVAAQQNSRQFVKTYIRSQASSQIPAGSANTPKIVHAHGATAVSSATQCATPLSGRSKLVAIRPAATAHSILKSYDITQLSGSPMTTVYLQQQPHNLHITNTQQPIVSLSSTRARECEEPRVVRSSSTSFANCGNLDSRRYLTSGRNVVGVGDISVRSSVRVNPLLSSTQTVIPSRNGCKLAAKDLLRGAKVVTRISDERTDMKPILMPIPAVNLCSTGATSVNALPNTCISVAAGQHDGLPGTSYPGPSARPTILRKNREPSSGSAVRRLIVAETHPQSGSYQEVLASPITTMKDEASLMCLKRTATGESRVLSGVPPSDTRIPGILARKPPAILIGNVLPTTKNYSDQVPVAGTPEVSPRRRLRKQNFDCTNTEKMKLLISNDRVTGDSFITMKDELTWKSADLDGGTQVIDDSVMPEKIPKRRGRVRMENGAMTMSLQQRLSTTVSQQINTDGHAKMKRIKKAQPMTVQNKIPEVPSANEPQSGLLLGGSSANERQAPHHVAEAAIGSLEAQANENWNEEAENQKIEHVTLLICHVFGLGNAVSGDQRPRRQHLILEKLSDSQPPGFQGDEEHGSSSSSESGESAVHITSEQRMVVNKEQTEAVESSSAVAGNMPSAQDDNDRSEYESRQIAENTRKIFAQMLRCSGLKDRWQRFDRMCGCERVLKRIYMKRWLLQKHYRSVTKHPVATNVELNSNVIATLEDYSAMAARRQTEKFLQNYPICSPSTSDEMFEKDMESGPSTAYKYLEEALEVCTRSMGTGSSGIRHASQKSTQIGGRSSRGLQPGSYASRRDPETEMLQSVAEVLAGVMEIVIENDENKEGKNQLGRKRKKKDDELSEIKIADRFGIFELPQILPQASNTTVALYDDVSQFTLSRKRKSEALDADDAFFMNIEKELHHKRKRTGGDKNISRTLHSLSQVRAVHQRLSDLRKAERDNVNETTKQMLDLVKYSDPTSYAELIHEHEEDCQPYDNKSVREEKWQKRLLSFTKAFPTKIIPTSSNYDPNVTIKLHPPMNFILRLLQGKYIRPPRRFRPGVKRARKSQSRRGRGRQRGIAARAKKKSPTPEPKLEDLEPHFTASEMSAMFKKEFGMDIRTFRYERYGRRSQQELNSTDISQNQPSVSREDEPMEQESEVMETSTEHHHHHSTKRDIMSQNRANEEDGVNVVVIDDAMETTSDEPVVTENGDHRAITEEGSDGIGNNVDLSETVPYIYSAENNDLSLLEHIQTRGRYIREHFATLLHALRISELVTVKAIKMFRDYTAELFDRDNRGANST